MCAAIWKIHSVFIENGFPNKPLQVPFRSFIQNTEEVPRSEQMGITIFRKYLPYRFYITPPSMFNSKIRKLY